LCSIRLKNKATFITVSHGYFPVCLQTACPKKLKRIGRKKGIKLKQTEKGIKFIKKCPLKLLLNLYSSNLLTIFKEKPAAFGAR